MSDFVLVDLLSQRTQVRQHLAGKSQAEVLAWLRSRGHLYAFEVSGRTMYELVSPTNRRAQFFFEGSELVSVGDHATFL